MRVWLRKTINCSNIAHEYVMYDIDILLCDVVMVMYSCPQGADSASC